MASGISLLIKGIGALVCFVLFILLLFINGIISQPIMNFIMAGDYPIAFGIDMIPIIQIVIAFLCLAGGILCFASAYIEVYAEVYYGI